MLRIASRPQSGLIVVDIPAASADRRALGADGAPLPCQFIPAPWPGPLAGRVLACLPEGAQGCVTAPGGPEPHWLPCPWVAAEEGALRLSLPGRPLRLHDRVQNGYTHENVPFGYCRGNEAFEPVWGTFPMFTPASRVAMLEGPLARVARVVTDLIDPQTGAYLGAKVCYDFIEYSDRPLLQVLACFDAVGATALGCVYFGDLALPADGWHHWRGGLPAVSGDLCPALGETAHGRREGFQPVSCENYLAVEGPEGGLAWVGGYPVLAPEDGALHLRPDNDLVSFVTLGDAAEFGMEAPLCGCLFYSADGPVDADAAMAAVPAYARAAEPEAPQTLKLSSGALTAELGRDGGGVWLRAMTDERTGESLLADARSPLFTAILRQAGGDRQYAIRSDGGWREVVAVAGEDRLTLVFGSPEYETLRGVGVRLTAVCDPQHSRITWEMDLTCANEGLTLVQAETPRLCYDAAGDTRVFSSRAAGMVYEHGGSLALHQLFTYPSYSSGLPYLAAWRQDGRRGLYCGVHDPLGSYKILRSELNGLTHRGFMSLTVPLPGIGQAGASVKVPGRCVWQLFDGDWYDAARIYRGWALERAAWVPPMGDDGRVGGCEWFKKTPLWFCVMVDQPNWLEDTLEAYRDIGIPAACHVYHWHEIPFDNDYPHYFPARKDFLHKLPALQTAGLKVMPYINGRLWDTRDRLNEDYAFSSVAKPGAAKGRAGKPVTESYVSREVDGSRVRLAAMCPASAVWQETQRALVNRLLNEVNVDGVYVDQVAAAPPVLCMDPTHPHPPGGGSWWQYAYYNLFDHLGRVTPADKGFAVECHGEVYMRCADGLLTWQWTQTGQVPAYPAVYGGVATYFGRAFSSDRGPGHEAFRILACQGLLYGEPLGWLSPRAYLDSPYRSLFKKLARIRFAHNDFFYAGHMQRPPEVSGAPDILCPPIMDTTTPNHYPAVSAALWQRRRDGARVLLVVNIDETPHAVTVDTHLPLSGAFPLAGDLTGPATIEKGRLALAMPPLSVTACILP